jgi:ribA/ribD-fused uncharacterized protein
MHEDNLLSDLRARFNAGEALKFLFFWGHKKNDQAISASCFSQWYEAPFELKGQHYATAEHYMMAEKAALFGDTKIREQILLAPNPGAAKALGRKVHNFDEPAWMKHRFAIVCKANHAKFAQNPPLHRFLANTGSRILVEASPVDAIWGIGLARDDKRAPNPNLWQGQNLLGFALMRVRDDLLSR